MQVLFGFVLAVVLRRQAVQKRVNESQGKCFMQNDKTYLMGRADAYRDLRKFVQTVAKQFFKEKDAHGEATFTTLARTIFEQEKIERAKADLAG